MPLFLEKLDRFNPDYIQLLFLNLFVEYTFSLITNRAMQSDPYIMYFIISSFSLTTLKIYFSVFFYEILIIEQRYKFNHKNSKKKREDFNSLEVEVGNRFYFSFGQNTNL